MDGVCFKLVLKDTSPILNIYLSIEATCSVMDIVVGNGTGEVIEKIYIKKRYAKSNSS